MMAMALVFVFGATSSALAWGPCGGPVCGHAGGYGYRGGGFYRGGGGTLGKITLR